MLDIGEYNIEIEYCPHCGQKLVSSRVEDPQRLCAHEGVANGFACPKCGAQVF